VVIFWEVICVRGSFSTAGLCFGDPENLPYFFFFFLNIMNDGTHFAFTRFALSTYDLRLISTQNMSIIIFKGQLYYSVGC
jgi:hypothetical protein